MPFVKKNIFLPIILPRQDRLSLPLCRGTGGTCPLLAFFSLDARALAAPSIRRAHTTFCQLAGSQYPLSQLVSFTLFHSLSLSLSRDR